MPRKFDLSRIVRMGMIFTPIALLAVASLIGLGYFITANTLLASVAIWLSIAAGVIALLVAIFLL